MPRLAGINIPDNKRIEISLTYIYGIGLTSSREILEETKIDGSKKAGTLAPDELNKLKEAMDKKLKIEGDLRREVMGNIKRLRDIGAWRGIRHARHLPVRGQRTKTNNRTVRGNVRKTVTSGKKAAPTPK